MGSGTTRVVAVDVGGTFTDVCVLDQGSGELEVAKVASTEDPIDGVMAGVEEAGIDLAETALFCHGTTVATNALITRRLPKAAMVCTKGFRDVVEIGRGTRDDLWDAYKDNAEPYIRRRDRLEVTERVDHTGEVLDDARRGRGAARSRGSWPGARSRPSRCASSTPTPTATTRRAWPRSCARRCPTRRSRRPPASCRSCSSTSASPRPSPTRSCRRSSPTYVNDLDKRLKDDGYDGDLLILHSGGGVMTPEAVQKLAVRLAASGIAAGAVAARYTAALCGHKNVIGVDMGGTSTDISLVYDGQLRTTNEWFVEYGHPICFPSIEVLTIGAGGGSLAKIDAAGSLRNGPQSAGSRPRAGGVRQGRRGARRTPTPTSCSAGSAGSWSAAACNWTATRRSKPIKTIGEPLDLDVHAAAEAIIAVANANMADAVRIISLQRGYDPREFALVVFGGAGPLHGAALAKELGVPTVLVPPRPGTWSALGCLMVDIRHDLERHVPAPRRRRRRAELGEAFERLESEGRELLEVRGRQPTTDVSLDRSIAMRYLGQWRSARGQLRRRPRRRRWSASTPSTSASSPTAATTRRSSSTGSRSWPPARPRTSSCPKHERERRHARADRDAHGLLRRRGASTRPSTSAASCPAGASFEGPAVIDQLDTTTLVPPGVKAEVDEYLNIRMEVN